MTRPAFGTHTAHRHHRRAAHPGQLQLVLLTLIRTGAPPLQLLDGGLSDVIPEPLPAVALRVAA